VYTVSRAIQTGALDPAMDDPSVLPCRDVRMIIKAAREQVLTASEGSTGKPVVDCRSGLFGNLELDRPAGFSLDHCGAVLHSATNAHVAHPEPHQVATPQLAIDGQIEECEVASVPLKLEPDRPYLLRFEGAFLAGQASLVPWSFVKANERWVRSVHGLSPRPDHPPQARVTERLYRSPLVLRKLTFSAEPPKRADLLRSGRSRLN
jgi:hypothetical protein